MNFLLDTCTLSELIRPVPDARVVAWTDRTPHELCYLSAISLGELEQGIERLAHGRRRARLEAWLESLVQEYEDRILAVDAAIARRWGKLSGALLRRGRTAGVIDGLIAATALRHDLTVATRNVEDFKPFGVGIVDPWSK